MPFLAPDRAVTSAAMFAFFASPSHRLRPIALASLVTSALVASCEAKSVHDEIFFACTPEAPSCPDDQRCDPRDNCCHPRDEPETAPLGRCQLGVSTSPGSAPPNTAPASGSSED